MSKFEERMDLDELRLIKRLLVRALKRTKQLERTFKKRAKEEREHARPATLVS